MQAEFYPVTKRRLVKSNHEKVVEGVCGGVAEFLGLDPVLVRLIWALSIFLGGTGVGAYVLASLIIPNEPGGPQSGFAPSLRFKVLTSSEFAMILGLILIGYGVYQLMDGLDLIPHWLWTLWTIVGRSLWPVLFILAGLALLFRKPSVGPFDDSSI